ncbi:FAD dependent oxidoreductase [Microdochium trichocladiopsis]|uniref:FAD dependent oxidoreductase n=1 Tax=Microdochium trichocladiopsis TaxID=1682393 RepID=A0A9P9BQF7_9PEZI|nr:FAD dependent oxidoreductase [Microdochium trichocladiopsis]KAH7025827.1 FAD dependent oxidoreductase [Microdochium trichocladiopsis]
MTQTTRVHPTQATLPSENPSKSYWHTQPSEKLLGHRTTSDLPESADVIIVGSGISGTFAAQTLREKRPELKVVMLEAREACWGATGRNGGHCQPLIYLQQPHVASFELRNYFHVKSLVEELSIPCDWRSTSGVHAFYAEDVWAAAQSTVSKLKDTYPDLAANVSLVRKGKDGSPAWLLEDERKELTLDALRIGNAEGAVIQWHAASLWPYKLVAFILEKLLAESANDDGGGAFNLQTKTPATGISRVVGGTNIKNHPWTVHTPRGNISASQVLLCTNGYTSHLLEQFSDLIVPVRGQVSALKPPQEPSPNHPPLDIGHTYGIIAGPADDYLIQRPPPSAELIFGGGRPHAKNEGVGVSDDSAVDEPVSWYLRGELSGLVDLSIRETNPSDSSAKPSTKADDEEASNNNETGQVAKHDLTPTHDWSGIMGYSRDEYPWVGPVPESLGGGKGLYLCGGYTGHGMPNAPLSAKAVVELMLSVMVGDDDEVDIPMEYLITEKRVNEARRRKPVGEEKVGVAGLRNY